MVIPSVLPSSAMGRGMDYILLQVFQDVLQISKERNDPSSSGRQDTRLGRE